jgi:hypothetical protein
VKVFRSVVIGAPIDRVWAAVRRLEIVDGTVFHETPLAHSDLEHFYSYDIIESPLPCRDYLSSHRFIPVTEDDRTLGIWEGHFDCAPEAEARLEAVVGDQIYFGGMRGLNDYLKERP